MDSGNSGSLSLQSSSGGGGGDDEFDSRCGGEDSSLLSALLRQPPCASSLLPGFGGSSFHGIQDLATPSMSRWPSTTPLPAGAGASSTAPHSSSSHGVAALAQQQQAVAAPSRASRKRSRASRRAPTTVLTTDTSNFRAMVQEFTGVPAPPFAGPGGARSSRFDHHQLFPSRSSAALSSPYLLRPLFAQKLHAASSSPYPPQPFVAMPSTTSSANKAIAPSTAPSTTSDSSYHQLALAAPSNVLGMQGHHGSGGNYLSFQSPIGAHQLDGNNGTSYPAAHPMFDAAGQRLPDPAGFSGLARGVVMNNSEGTTQLHPARRCDHSSHGGDELSGLVGAASVSSTDGSASRAAPRLERNAQSTTTTTTPVAATAGMRAPAGVESWICTSDCKARS